MKALETAAQISLRILDFWELTPFEFSLMVKEYIDKAQQLKKDQITMAYLVAYWGRVKDLPQLSEVLNDLSKNDKSKNPEQSAEQMLVAIKAMNAAMGGEVVE